MPFSTDLNAHNFYSKPPLPQFNVDIIRQPHVRSIGIISTTLNWGVWGGGSKLNYTNTMNMTYDRSCVSTILSKIVAPMGHHTSLSQTVITFVLPCHFHVD